jgi:hypothetical protein
LTNNSSYVAIDGKLAGLFWCKPPSGAQVPILCSCKAFVGLMWDALSDKRTGLPFTNAAGCRHRSHSRPEVARDSKNILLSPFPDSSNFEHQVPKSLSHYCVFFRCRGNSSSTELFPSNCFCTVFCYHSWHLALGVHVSIINVCTLNIMPVIRGSIPPLMFLCLMTLT